MRQQMRQPTSKITTAGDAPFRGAIEEITFQASILALHVAIQAESEEGPCSPGDVVVAQRLHQEFHTLVECVQRPDSKGL
jgi:hypothetical protein